MPATIAFAPSAEAKVIERACLSSDRKARNRALCGCIQQVANFSLSKSEQRLGAKFFKKPQLAQDTRQSDSPTKERFWKKWKAFGATASSYCS
ncbi:hypothetical protein IV417_15300 [Alphaproteobacteria bacterium KMM 3653]|uniref:Uncharacterized protein n=2 Tax=Harenicola maris TaxID=2841044 RepID=A0AAP2CRQ9_9RHOB|nr:hypothetical protein [Harenicola maris]